MKSRHWLLPVIAVCLMSCAKKTSPSETPSDAVFTSGQAASVVVGQPDFTSNTPDVTASVMEHPYGISVSSSGVFYVSDQNNSRVLGYLSIPSTNGASADVVVGQTVFTFPASGSGADELHTPQNISTSGSDVFVADWGNHRVLIYTLPGTGAAATIAVGQAGPALGVDPGGGGVTSTTLRFPSAVFVAGSKMAIADGGFNRVLLYNSIPVASGAAADVALGQANKTSSAAGVATMSSPGAVWTDGTKIVVSEVNNHRVLIWNSWPTLDGTAPDVILGQSDLTTNVPNNGGLSASSLFNPRGVTSDGTELYVADSSNHRILQWKTWPTTNMQEADLVLGQDDFTTNASGITSTTLDSPVGLHLESTSLIVADSGNNRVLIFNKQ